MTAEQLTNQVKKFYLTDQAYHLYQKIKAIECVTNPETELGLRMHYLLKRVFERYTKRHKNYMELTGFNWWDE